MNKVEHGGSNWRVDSPKELPKDPSVHCMTANWQRYEIKESGPPQKDVDHSLAAKGMLYALSGFRKMHRGSGCNRNRNTNKNPPFFAWVLKDLKKDWANVQNVCGSQLVQP